MATPARDISVLDQVHLPGPSRPVDHGLRSAHGAITIEDLESHATALQPLLNPVERRGGFFPEIGLVGLVSGENRAGEVVRRGIARLDHDGAVLGSDIRQLAHGHRIGGDILRRILTEERSGNYGSRDQGRKQLIHGAHGVGDRTLPGLKRAILAAKPFGDRLLE